MRHQEWITNVCGTSSIREIALNAELPIATLHRHYTADELTFDEVAAIARAYNVDLIPALVATGFIKEEETKNISMSGSLATATAEELNREILRRICAGKGYVLSEPLDSVVARGLESAKQQDHLRVVEDDEDELMVASHTNEYIPPDDEFIP